MSLHESGCGDFSHAIEGGQRCPPIIRPVRDTLVSVHLQSQIKQVYRNRVGGGMIAMKSAPDKLPVKSAEPKVADKTQDSYDSGTERRPSLKSSRV